MKQAQYHALIVDDEPDIRELLELTLTRMGVACEGAETLEEARDHLNRSDFNLCLADMRLPDGSGIELVRHIQQHRPELPVAVITAHGNMSLAIEALKAGAFDFVNKPVELATLRELVSTALKMGRRDEAPNPTSPSGRQLLGESEVIRTIRATINKLARSQAPIYISGESGTGKELIARLIHENGPRADKPFVPVNCGAIPADLMESELFGYCKGSFTGATHDKPGLFQAAQGGTLFLDELADLPLAMQVKLLRAIQEKAIRPLGAQKEVHIDVRILSATHQDLATLVREGRFREDLFYRINVIQLQAPTLRERPEDIPILVEHILERLAGELGVEPLQLDDSAREALGSYAFPGNVRELENILERAVTLCEQATIGEELLQLPEGVPVASSEVGGGDFELESYLMEIERKIILNALEETRFNKTAAAKRLGLSFRSLRYRLKKLDIE
ncbi:sigma-54-dependent transcriptional regulator [Thiohalomonas denitrificans]|uniref:Two-component system, NtrC family, response regulator PilR n=1 Tax=Thiohalomonas denitrificans TaxID=415747 RepID=A0A1G5PMA4_9GAMM|nr:sigma-54 dependent transcriptional regulator [Thiohalomonas denitrificans]SCZ50341.1 two-component system, NtrC family, response regulator PilR [Thiohalomonas denitrificans]